jgi:vancomycin resistance protein YoaR
MTTIPADSHNSPGISPWFIRLPILFISGAVLLVLVLVSLAGVFQLYYRDRIIPGVYAYGIDLSGMTVDEARRALESKFTYDDEAVFTFRDGETFWQMNAGTLGVAFDAQATAVEAFAAGHSGNPLLDLIDQMLIWLNGHGISPTVRYDQNVAVTELEAIAQQLNQAPQNATFSIIGTAVNTTPSQVGRIVDILSTLNRLENTIVSLGTGAEVSLVINETPPQVWDAEAAAAKARIALSSAVTLVADAQNGQTLGPWTATPEQIAQILKPIMVDNGDGTMVYDITLDMNVFSGYLETLAPGLITTPQNARFQFNDDTRVLEVIEPAVNGRSLNIPQTLARMEYAVFQPGDRTAMMAFDYTLPEYHADVTAAELGITELVSQATTYYGGSTQPRRENIAQAASRFNGLLIGPGEEFSFNYWVGDISPEEGFVEGKVIVGGRTIDGVGGGVCQVSTTAFQAAFYAGFPILERYAHGYQVGYYNQGEGVGMDAAIYTPDLDFRFLNDTPYHLLIETSVFPGSDAIQFRFYSTKTGRQVVKEGPVIENVRPAAPTVYEPNSELQPGQTRQVDWAAEGKDVTVTRVILDANGNEVDRDVFVSRYQPWGAVVQVAPGQVPANS